MNMFIISCKLIKQHLHCHMNHYDTLFFQKFHRKRLYFCIRLPKMGKIRVVCLMNVIFTQRCSKFTENTMLDVDVLENNGNFWFEIVAQAFALYPSSIFFFTHGILFTYYRCREMELRSGCGLEWTIEQTELIIKKNSNSLWKEIYIYMQILSFVTSQNTSADSRCLGHLHNQPHVNGLGASQSPMQSCRSFPHIQLCVGS